MHLELYIEDLLYRYECVIVPNFGAFLTHYKPAQIHKTTNAFYPPKKEISFNVQLQSNDGLLTSYISSVEKSSYETVLKNIGEIVEEWHKTLDSGKKITLKNIGVLFKDENYKLQFQPSYHINYLTDSFGLSSFVSQVIDRTEKEQKPISLPIIPIKTGEQVVEKDIAMTKETAVVTAKKETTRKTNVTIWIAACFVLGLCFVGYNFYDNYQNKIEIVVQEAEKKVNKEIQEATFAIPIDLKAIELKLLKNEKSHTKQPFFFVIAGAFREEENANRQVRVLKRRKFDAVKLKKNKSGLHQVAYARFNNRAEANIFLTDIRNQGATEAWLLIVKE